jgi:hypothetical protein
MKRDDLGTLGVSVPSAGKAIGLGRNAAYEAARRKELPTIRIGRRLVVPVEALKRMLAEVPHAGDPAT